jgi:hypothetical protein
MTGKDHCHDKAITEGLFATLKKELVHRVTFLEQRSSKDGICEFIEVLNNSARNHL